MHKIYFRCLSEMIDTCYLCRERERKRLKPEYFTTELKEMIAVYYFEQKEYAE